MSESKRQCRREELSRRLACWASVRSLRVTEVTDAQMALKFGR